MNQLQAHQPQKPETENGQENPTLIQKKRWQKPVLLDLAQIERTYGGVDGDPREVGEPPYTPLS